ncbi:MAG: DUF411 domain-containing protein [Pseudomonas sp.]|uniref:DUF411 domain-containing protein n=1 Tax=Pseudomonas sp. TaxID=306 RepID=UPI0033986FDE
MRRLVLLTSLLAGLVQAAEPIAIEVFRDPNCGCCKAWINHLEDNGFTVTDRVESNMSAVKSRLGVPPRLASCHTGVINGQFIEGHVPAADILKLRQRPDLLGAAVPGMPTGSPGMERGALRDAYQVIGLDAQGGEAVLADYPALPANTAR